MFDQIYFEQSAGLQLIEENPRCLNFSGAKNFRDLGGYRTTDGRTTRWGMLYRSDALHKLTHTDMKFLAALSLDRIIDFRADHEREQEPDRIPTEMGIHYVEIPIMDSSTRVWHVSRDEFVKKIKELNPHRYMTETNMELATRFTPELSRFFREVLFAKGKPVLFHCAAGKDRTGFAAAVLLRILGVPHETIMEDYLLTNSYLVTAYRLEMMLLQLLKGKKFTQGVRGFMEARPEYLLAAFEALEQKYGSFENYIHTGLGLSESDIQYLRQTYLT